MLPWYREQALSSSDFHKITHPASKKKCLIVFTLQVPPIVTQNQNLDIPRDFKIEEDTHFGMDAEGKKKSPSPCRSLSEKGEV